MLLAIDDLRDFDTHLRARAGRSGSVCATHSPGSVLRCARHAYTTS